MRNSDLRSVSRCRQHLPVTSLNLWAALLMQNFIRILVTMRLQGYMELIKGDYTVEESVRLAREIGIHADAGTTALIKYLKEQKEVYRR
ncbi:hypothetical protein [Blautia sp. MSJ-9]|uniref:hypothetical protein n=1 Tax=Blautia sp. MSJ-9 TaxID=2841511 RepID=UPI001C0FFFA4|nr:hypothetical protein [Blautia sp. MSJ-9]MBU5681497.1 hypothetical protein [Blautia sp. MSJ-9]